MNTMDKDQLMQSINSFISSFNEHIDRIENITIEQNTKRYKKILFVSVIEGLAKCRYPKKFPRNRFVKFVRKFGNWEFGDNISLPHLVAALERTAATQFDPLREYAFKKLSKWGTGGPLYLDKDPKKSEIQSLWPKMNGALMEIPCLRKKIDEFCHVGLLYEYRNYLVHESRQPTFTFESDRDTKPFYEVFPYSVSDGVKVNQFRLSYPSGFLYDLSKKCLKNLEVYLIENKRDPFDSFTFGSYLLEELNNDDSFPVVRPFTNIN